jgi:acetyltransferase-like isoleucine patch superfamily enzyme
MQRTSRLRLCILASFAVLPSFCKRPLYRLFFGYRIGRRVRIGVSIIDAGKVDIGDDVSIGHLNIITRVADLTIKDHSRIGQLNIIRGGSKVSLGRYSEIMRLNEINSIPEPDSVNELDPQFLLGDGSIVTTGHKIDFTDKVELGRRVILGGRNSSLWTHNRQRTLPITIGDLVYLGSEIRMAPGSSIGSRCIVGIGAVITGELVAEGKLIGGVPGKVIKDLSDEDHFLVERKTRPDMPDEL